MTSVCITIAIIANVFINISISTIVTITVFKTIVVAPVLLSNAVRRSWLGSV